MSLAATQRAWSTPGLTTAQLIVLLRLADRANDSGECWPSVRTLAADTRQSERTVRAALAELERMGHITRRRRVSQVGTDMTRLYKIESVDFDGGQEIPPRLQEMPPPLQEIPPRGHQMQEGGELNAPKSSIESPIESTKESKEPPQPPGGEVGEFALTHEPAKPAAQDKHQAIAVMLLGELSAARIRVDRRCVALKPVPGNLEHIKARLKAGYSADDLRHVIAVCEARAKHDSAAREYFDAVSPFRKGNIGRWSAMSLEQAQSPAPLHGPQRWPSARAPAPDVDRTDDVLTRFEKGPRR